MPIHPRAKHGAFWLFHVKDLDLDKENYKNDTLYSAIVAGASYGGLTAFGKIFSKLPENLSLVIIAVQHLHPSNKGYIVEYLRRKCSMPVVEASDKSPALPGCIFTAPANYHLLIEKDKTFSLNIDPKVNYSRPSIDVLFESAARVWKSGLIGIILTGANNDGSKGLGMIKAFGGLTIAQDPATAECPVMPMSAINAGVIDMVMDLKEIRDFLIHSGTLKMGKADA